jgi:hypothetical protein
MEAKLLVEAFSLFFGGLVNVDNLPFLLDSVSSVINNDFYTFS